MDSKARYKVGDLVSVAKWDATEAPNNRIHSPAKVLTVTRSHCQTGFMLYVAGPTGKTVDLDQDWVSPWVSTTQGGQP